MCQNYKIEIKQFLKSSRVIVSRFLVFRLPHEIIVLDRNEYL